MRTSNRELLRSTAPVMLGVAAIVTLAALGSERMRGLLANTAQLTLGALAISLPLGVVLGVYIAKTDLPGRRCVAGMLVGLLFVPLCLYAAAWQAALGDDGWAPHLFSSEPYARPWLRGWLGAICVHAAAATCWTSLLTAASLLSVERQIEEESLLDAQPWQVLWRVSLHRGLGGMLTAAIWVCIICSTEIGVTDLFGVRTFAEEIYTEASLGSLSGGGNLDGSNIDPNGDGESAGGGILARDLTVGVLILAVLLCAGLWTAARWLPTVSTLQADGGWRWRPRRSRWVMAAGGGALIAVVALVPIVSLAWKAGVDVQTFDGALRRDWSAMKLVRMVARSFVEHRREWTMSFSVGLVVAIAATAVGGLLAWWGRLHRGAAIFAALIVIMLLAIPSPLLGVWTIRLMNHPYDSPLWQLTWLYDHTYAAPALVQFARVLPLTVLILWTQLATIPQDLFDAATSEGAGPLRWLWRVALPIRWPGVLAAGIVALVAAMGELSATLLVYPPGVTPLSVRVFQLLHYGVDDRVAALSLAMILSVAALTAAAGLALACSRSGHRLK